MFEAIDNTYKPDDLHFNICNSILRLMHVLHNQFECTVTKISEFVKSNEEAILNKTRLTTPVLSLSEAGYTDLRELCDKSDDHTDTLYEHLNVILRFANKGVSKEERYINKLIKTFAPKCSEIAEQIKANDTKVMNKENMELIVNTFKPNIDELNDEDNQYNTDILFKIIFIKLKTYLNKVPFASIFGDKIREEPMMEMIDMGLVDDLDTLNDNKLEVIRLAASSGLLSYFDPSSLLNIFDQSATSF